MKIILLFAVLVLGGCATAQLEAPAKTYHTAKARAEAAECLMNRLASGDFRVHREVGGAATMVRVTGIAGTYFLFTLTDSPAGGTDASVRRANAIAPGLHNAETCFDG